MDNPVHRRDRSRRLGDQFPTFAQVAAEADDALGNGRFAERLFTR